MTGIKKALREILGLSVVSAGIGPATQGFSVPCSLELNQKSNNILGSTSRPLAILTTVESLKSTLPFSILIS